MKNLLNNWQAANLIWKLVMLVGLPVYLVCAIIDYIETAIDNYHLAQIHRRISEVVASNASLQTQANIEEGKLDQLQEDKAKAEEQTKNEDLTQFFNTHDLNDSLPK